MRRPAVRGGAVDQAGEQLLDRRAFLSTLRSLAVGWLAAGGAISEGGQLTDEVLRKQFEWTVGPPLIMPANRPDDPCHAIKDPSIVYYQGRWHLFCTIRSRKRSHQIEYLSFVDFKDANNAQRHVLKLIDGYFAAPQIFYFSPRQRWYLIYQVVDQSRKPPLQPAYSTTTDIADPTSWSKPVLLFSSQPDNVKRWIDFWIICDTARAHLFFTSLDGRMWRSETKLSDFPGGWDRPVVALHDDIYEASHTYRLKGQNKYLTVIEAQSNGLLDFVSTAIKMRATRQRYYKAYLADRLDGRWLPLAVTKQKPFASLSNVRETGPHWTDSFSHGELIRDGFDETLAVDPARLRFLFQGVSDEERGVENYGAIPWRLGMLEAVRIGGNELSPIESGIPKTLAGC